MAITDIASAYTQASKRLLLLDYDGVLVPIAPTPEQAAPTDRTYAILGQLLHDPRNTCVIISGRSHETLDEWFGHLPIALVAEHGLWRKRSAERWVCTVDVATEWKQTIRGIMMQYQAEMPGSFIEEKHAGLVLHYREAVGDVTAKILQLIDELQEPITRLSLKLLHGKKIVEIMPAGISKGEAAQYWLDMADWDFVMGAGDDATDETMFTVLPTDVYSIKVGDGPTAARFSIPTQEAFVELLGALRS